MKFREIFESNQLTINDLLSPEEQQNAVEAIKRDDGSVRDFEELAYQRLKQMGVNVRLNAAVFLKWKHAVDQKVNPKKWAATSGSWDGYADAREQGRVQGMGPGGQRNWTGD